MSDGWLKTTVGEYSPFVYGKAIKKDDQRTMGIPVYGSNGIYTYSDSALVQQHAVIIGRKGSVGKVHLSTEKCWISDTAFYVIKDSLDESYFVYYLLSSLGLENMNTDAAVPGLNRDNAHRLEIKIPNSIEKRTNLVEPLIKLDQKIHLNNQINQTLESIAQAIFKSWFIDFDPVRAKIAAKQEGNDPELAAMCAISGKSEVELEQMSEGDFAELQATAALFPDELVESELGEVPKGWELQSLYDTAEFVNGAAFKAKDFSSNTNEGLPIIKIAELKQGLSAQTKYTNLSFDQKYRVRSGDIFYSWSGSPETSLDVFKWFGGDGWLNQHIFKINTESKGKTYFVYYLLKYLKPTLIRLATNKQTTGLGHITVADMKSLQVIKPEEHLFLRYAKIVAPFYEKESFLKQEIINLAMLRDTLLPKLLSGEISLNKNMGSIDD